MMPPIKLFWLMRAYAQRTPAELSRFTVGMRAPCESTRRSGRYQDPLVQVTRASVKSHVIIFIVHIEFVIRDGAGVSRALTTRFLFACCWLPGCRRAKFFAYHFSLDKRK